MKLKEVIEEYTEKRLKNGSTDPLVIMVMRKYPDADVKVQFVPVTPGHGLDLETEMPWWNGAFSSVWKERTGDAGPYRERYCF